MSANRWTADEAMDLAEIDLNEGRWEAARCWLLYVSTVQQREAIEQAEARSREQMDRLFATDEVLTRAPREGVVLGYAQADVMKGELVEVILNDEGLRFMADRYMAQAGEHGD